MSALAARRGRAALPLLQDPTAAYDVTAWAKENESADFVSAYELSPEIIGQGCFGMVKVARRKDATKSEVAVKIISTKDDDEICEAVQQEFDLLNSLMHPNIVKAYDLFFSLNRTTSFLCMERIIGQTLQATVCIDGALPEFRTRPLFEHLTAALHYLHSKRCAHRDLKPDNLLIATSTAKLTICDFNCARMTCRSSFLTSRVGTAAFAAPELLLARCSAAEPLDVWAAGLCLYFALSGGGTLVSSTPRRFSSVLDYGRYLASATASEREAWLTRAGVSASSLSTAGFDVLNGCLEPDPSQRLDAESLKRHAWFASTGALHHAATANKNFVRVLPISERALSMANEQSPCCSEVSVSTATTEADSLCARNCVQDVLVR